MNKEVRVNLEGNSAILLVDNEVTYLIADLEHELGESQMDIEDFKYMSVEDKIGFLEGSLADAEYYCGEDKFKAMREEIEALNLEDFITYNIRIDYKEGCLIVNKAGLKEGNNQKAIAECSFYDKTEENFIEYITFEFDVPNLEKYFEKLYIKQREHLIGHSEVLVMELEQRLIEGRGYVA